GSPASIGKTRSSVAACDFSIHSEVERRLAVRLIVDFTNFRNKPLAENVTMFAPVASPSARVDNLIPRRETWPPELTFMDYYERIFSRPANLLCLLGLTATLFTNCTNKAAQQGFDRPPAPVTVTEAVMQD